MLPILNFKSQYYTNSGWLEVQYRVILDEEKLYWMRRSRIQCNFSEYNILYIGRLTIHHLIYSPQHNANAFIVQYNFSLPNITKYWTVM